MLEIAGGERGAAGDGDASDQYVSNTYGATAGFSLGEQLCRMRCINAARHWCRKVSARLF